MIGRNGGIHAMSQAARHGDRDSLKYSLQGELERLSSATTEFYVDLPAPGRELSMTWARTAQQPEPEPRRPGDLLYS